MMKTKVPFFDKYLREEYYKILSVISSVASLFFIFVDIPSKYKVLCGLIFVLLLIIVYVGQWLIANCLRKTTLKINNTTLEIFERDLFTCSGYKIIAFNEFFDTQVDGSIITDKSLNGQYILQFHPDVLELDEKIKQDTHAQRCIKQTIHRPHLPEKAVQYKLGTIIKDDQFLLLAFSRFENDNKAFLTMNDYINCLLNMWQECDAIYGMNTLVFPLLGSGITRFSGYENISDQELLETFIWTLKVSGIRFQYPAKVQIVLQDKNLKNINLYEINRRFRT